MEIETYFTNSNPERQANSQADIQKYRDIF